MYESTCIDGNDFLMFDPMQEEELECVFYNLEALKKLDFP